MEGVWDTPTIRLEPAQIFFVVQLFGFRAQSGIGRRYSEALFVTARKNAKSTLSSGVGGMSRCAAGATRAISSTRCCS